MTAVCCICGWEGEVGIEAHGLLIHPDRKTAVVEQMDRLFLVSLDIPQKIRPLPPANPSLIGRME